MKKIIFFILNLLFIGCNSNSSSNQNFNNKIILTPYSLDKFKPILKQSKLQAPTSKFDPNYSTKYGEFEGFYNKYFYLQNNKYMTFFMCENNESEHKRSELRFKNDFNVSSNEKHILKAKLKILPLTEEKEFTFIQIHTDNNIENNSNKPLLRIAWKKQYNNIYNHIWAIITLNTDENPNYFKIDLGKMDNFFNIEIDIENSYLSIWINDEEKLNNFDVSYWNKYLNYFKTGVYLNGKGCAETLVDTLEVK